MELQEGKDLLDPSCFKNYDEYERYLEKVVPPQDWFYHPDPILKTGSSVFTEILSDSNIKCEKDK